MSPPERTEALILRMVDYGEADRILTLLTRDRGKVSAFARGARKSRRRYPGLDLMVLIQADLQSRRSGMLTLLGADLVRSYPAIRQDMGRLSLALCMVEMVREGLAEGEAAPEVYGLLTGSLGRINEASSLPVWALLAFGVRLMPLLGLMPLLDLCGLCGAPLPQGQGACLDLARGSVLCPDHPGHKGPKLCPDALRLLQALAQGHRPPEDYPNQPIYQAEEALLDFLEHHLGRAMKSRGFLRGL